MNSQVQLELFPSPQPQFACKKRWTKRHAKNRCFKFGAVDTNGELKKKPAGGSKGDDNLFRKKCAQGDVFANELLEALAELIEEDDKDFQSDSDLVRVFKKAIAPANDHQAAKLTAIKGNRLAMGPKTIKLCQIASDKFYRRVSRVSSDFDYPELPSNFQGWVNLSCQSMSSEQI